MKQIIASVLLNIEPTTLENDMKQFIIRCFYTLAEGIMISVRSLQRSEGDCFLTYYPLLLQIELFVF